MLYLKSIRFSNTEIRDDINFIGGITMSNFLVVTHQLSYTGAPIVLLDMVRTLQKEGNNIDMISLLDGELRSEVEKMQISLSIQDRFLCQEEDFRTKVSKYDAVIVNTLICYEVIHILKTMKIPVLWWIHEGKHFFEYFKTVIPDIATLPSNIHVYSVSGYVQRVIKERYDVWTPILHFGVEDAKKTVELSLTERVPKHKESVITFEEWDSRHKKIRFLTVAVYAMAKGQDFAIDAIEHMPEDIRKKCLFVFCGEEEEGKADSNILDKVIKASSKYEEVIHIPRQSHETVLKLMSEMDYLLVPSRIEPMPTVACEAMMMHKTVVISNVCGVADDIIDDWNGFVFKAEDVDDLCRAINRVSLLDKKEYEIICDRARIDYENKYAMEVFTPRVEQIMSHIKRRRKLILMISGRDILDIFIYAMKPTFCEMGYEVMEFNSKEIMNSLQKLEFFLDSPITAVLAFNNTGMNMELVEGKNIWEQLQTPFINFLMDHPFAHKRAMDMTPLTGIVLCPDKNHMKYVQRFYPQIAVTGFMAHAAKKLNMLVPKICDRRTIIVART